VLSLRATRNCSGALLLACLGCRTAELGTDAVSTEASHAKRWHLDAAMRGGYTKLASTKQTLDRRLDIPMRLDWLHVFDEPYTPLDRRSDQGFGSWYLGLGRTESDSFVWTWYAGGGMAQDLNHQRFLNANLKIDFRYAFVYTGVVGEYYPWRVPAAEDGMTWLGRFQASRPFLTAGVETGYVSAEGEGDYKVTGATLYHDELKIRDWLASLNLGVGWSLPISDHWSLNLSGDYRFHVYRPEEYNGWNWTTCVRYHF